VRAVGVVSSFNDENGGLVLTFCRFHGCSFVEIEELYNSLFESVTIGRTVRPQIGENWRDRSAICQCRRILFKFAAKRVG